MLTVGLGTSAADRGRADVRSSRRSCRVGGVIMQLRLAVAIGVMQSDPV